MNPDDLNNLLGAVPDSTKEKLLNPSAQAVGGAAGVVLTAATHVLFDRLIKFNIVRDKDIADFREKINGNLQQIPVEERDDDNAGQVVRALDTAKYSLDTEYMRAAFARLIASALDKRVNGTYYPSYADILAAMSPDEAKLLSKINNNFGHQVPTFTLSAKNKDTDGTRPVLPKNLIFDNDAISNGSSEIPLELLKRSGLVEIHNDKWLTHPQYTEKYDAAINLFTAENYIQALRKNNDIMQNEDIVSVKGYISLTEIGESFSNLVLTNNI